MDCCFTQEAECSTSFLWWILLVGDKSNGGLTEVCLEVDSVYWEERSEPTAWGSSGLLVYREERNEPTAWGSPAHLAAEQTWCKPVHRHYRNTGNMCCSFHCGSPRISSPEEEHFQPNKSSSERSDPLGLQRGA